MDIAAIRAHAQAILDLTAEKPAALLTPPAGVVPAGDGTDNYRTVRGSFYGSLEGALDYLKRLDERDANLEEVSKSKQTFHGTIPVGALSDDDVIWLRIASTGPLGMDVYSVLQGVWQTDIVPRCLASIDQAQSETLNWVTVNERARDKYWFSAYTSALERAVANLAASRGVTVR